MKIKREDFSVADKYLFKLKAWKKNKPVKLTVPNPDKRSTNEKHIKVEATKYWGEPNRNK